MLSKLLSMKVVLLKYSITILLQKNSLQRRMMNQNKINHYVIRYLQVSYYLIAKSLESKKLHESIALKSTITKQANKKNDITFKLEFDKNANLQTQRKSQDTLNVDKKTNNFAIIQNMFELETKNLEIYMQAQEKNIQIQQLKSQLEQQKIKQDQLVRQQNQEREELLQKIHQLENQCEQQSKYINQIPLMQVEAQEWKDRFLYLNKLFHQSQEVLFRIEAEQQSTQKRNFKDHQI